jgi:hopanoid-associated phosphorylase
LTGVLGVVAALAIEQRWIRSSEACVERSGVGASRAEAAARRLVEQGATALVSWGVAGGLDPDLRTGTVILPERVIDAEGTSFGVDLVWRDRVLERVQDRIAISPSPIVSVPRPVATPQEKSTLHRRTGAGGADMESAAVAAFAGGTGVPFIAVRVIVDSADVTLPVTVMTLCDKEGRLKTAAIVRLLLRPREWPALMVLGRANAVAGRTMKMLASLAGPDLALS